MGRSLLLVVAWLANTVHSQTCSDTSSDNYDQYSTNTGDDCFYAPTLYCSDPLATNYLNPTTPPSKGKYFDAPWTCTYHFVGCTDPAAENYQSFITVPNNVMCQYAGCNDTEATNFNSLVRTPLAL
jgi:hypothetical protein